MLLSVDRRVRELWSSRTPKTQRFPACNPFDGRCARQVKTKSREAFRHLPRPPPRSPSPSEVAHENTAVETAGAGDTERVTSAATKKAVTALTSELKGVGPATASAILAALSGGCPFDADEVSTARRRRICNLGGGGGGGWPKEGIYVSCFMAKRGTVTS